ncbi:MAG: oligosaccharide flippase family protein [Acidobacteriaceae bacterium]|nr:oligosaccharide flippase family protein [Acidobacteriaceae bacterium]MBV9038004.1 oligosaccharide flippase family protein [Acidobacteriaceae bacterium]MBV9939269.1 oligosaccharide flippase family protein [Acidobacteriaceae bacterium]
MIALLEREEIKVEKSAPESVPAPRQSAAAYLLSSTSALGAGVVVERGFGFLANLLAARMGGAGTFGAYSLAIATANNIGTYAAGGIGATATRFSGKYPLGTKAYPAFVRVLLIVSLVSAAIAAAILWAGSAPLAHLLQKESLTPLLHWAAFSAAGMILLECCRGFLVGQRRLLGILVLSLSVGLGMISSLPAMSHLGPIPMVCSQGLLTTAAVLLCLLLYRPLGLASPLRASKAVPIGPMLREIWSFTLIQLAGLVGMNAAGWWLTSLVARSDASMVQMGFYAIANQLRNMVALAPGLLSQSSLAVMADCEGDLEKAPDRVMALCSFVAVLASLAIAGIGIILAPWALTILYGKAYSAASAATVLSLATAVVHMGSAPAAGRLTIVSIKQSGYINTAWAILVALSATFFLFHPGNASIGAAIILAAHILSALLVLLALQRKSIVPPGVSLTFLTGVGTSITMAALAIARNEMPGSALPLNLALLVVFGGGLALIFSVGHRHHWLPNRAVLITQLGSKLPLLNKLNSERVHA